MAVGPSNQSSDLVPSCSVAVVLTSNFSLISSFACGYARELYIGVGGTVVAVLLDDGGTTQTYLNVASGTTLSGKFVTVNSTGNGTTATNIIARR